MAQITVPLLTIVPIPYIAINSIDINFKANISASAASTETENSSSSVDTSVSASARCFWARGSMNASYSSKKDSSATRDSKYSVEYTMDVAVHAPDRTVCLPGDGQGAGDAEPIAFPSFLRKGSWTCSMPSRTTEP